MLNRGDECQMKRKKPRDARVSQFRSCRRGGGELLPRVTLSRSGLESVSIKFKAVWCREMKSEDQLRSLSCNLAASIDFSPTLLDYFAGKTFKISSLPDEPFAFFVSTFSRVRKCLEDISIDATVHLFAIIMPLLSSPLSSGSHFSSSFSSRALCQWMLINKRQ